MKKTTTWLALVAIIAVVASALFASRTTPLRPAPRPSSASEAWQRLVDGNQRFAAGKPKHPHEASSWRGQLEEGQHPFAVVLGCSDSRVPPELIFDQGFGDLFVIRVAGNVVDTDVIGSIEYAVDYLGTPLVVVMGHTDCGAVSATLRHLQQAGQAGNEPEEVISLIHRIEPAAKCVSHEMSWDKQVDQVVRGNVRQSMELLEEVDDLKRSLVAGKVSIIGAVYDVHTGLAKVVSRDPPEGNGCNDD